MLIQCLPIGYGSRCPDSRQRPPLAGQSAGEVRTVVARNAGAHRPAGERHAPAAGLRAAGRDQWHVTFPVAEMTQVAGRPIFAGLHMLLSAERLFSLPDQQRLPAILAESRKYQNTVSTQLAEQVLAALYELLRGFQAADDQRTGSCCARC